jgi:hypothetical protein
MTIAVQLFCEYPGNFPYINVKNIFSSFIFANIFRVFVWLVYIFYVTLLLIIITLTNY